MLSCILINNYPLIWAATSAAKSSSLFSIPSPTLNLSNDRTFISPAYCLTAVSYTHLMAMAGYNPEEAIKAEERMMKLEGKQNAEILSSHPSSQNRICLLYTSRCV